MKITSLQLKNKIISAEGFILPLTMVLMTLILLVSVGITSIIVRQAKFSRIIKDSQVAYNAADMAVGCTTYIDNTFTNSSTTYGIFPTDPVAYPVGTAADQTEINATITDINNGRTTRGVPLLANSNAITCGGFKIFSPAESSIVYTAFTYTKSDLTTEAGKTSTFTVKIPLTNGEFRCAKVILNKSPSYGQIVASGYSTCDTYSPSRVERVIVSSTENS